MSAVERSELHGAGGLGADPELSDAESSAGSSAESEPGTFVLPGASLSFKDLGFSVQLKDGGVKTILEPCTGHFEPGQLVALMGPSGCGKSTLLDMLAMKKTAKHSGQVYVNGHLRDRRTFSRIAAYVGQEDVMPEHWRVREAIQFNAKLKTRPSRALKHGEAPVDMLLSAFGLAGVANTYIGGPGVRGISGGQRRRVTLARGVAAQASLLFCDEPTSGLSATDAELCIKALHDIAKSVGVLILVVIHQPRPEVAQLFDTLVLLTSDPGRVCYMGPMGQAVEHMASVGRPVPQHVNPTDYFLDLVTPGLKLDSSQLFVEAFLERLQPALTAQVQGSLANKGRTAQEMLKAKPGTRLGKYAVSFRMQFWQLLRRKLAIVARNPLAIGVPVVLPALLGLVLGIMFSHVGDQQLQSQVSFIYTLITVLGIGGLQMMPILIDERHYMKHETSEALYTESASVLASFCVDVPLAFAGATAEVLIAYAMSGIDGSHLQLVFFWCMLTFFVYDSLYGLIAAAAQNSAQAQAIATPILAVFMLCNGFIITKAGANKFISNVFPISPNMYSMQAIVVDLAPDAGPTGDYLMAYTGYADDENVRGIWVLLASIAILRTLQVLALKLMHNIQR